jgi:predicted nucleotidyltransferase
MGGAGMPRPSAEEMAKVERMKAEPVPSAEESLARIDAAAASLGMDRAAVTSKWRSRNLVDVEHLPQVDPRDLAILARAVEAAVKR